MNTYIALFRGINVGGNNILPMKELSNLLDELGFKEIKTYIQSGNVVFQSKKKRYDKIAGEISSGILEQFGFEPKVLILEQTDLLNAIKNNPYKTEDGKALHFFFMESQPVNPNMERLLEVKAKSEEFRIVRNVFYLYAPDGIGRSKLASIVEKCMGVPGTARNWNTVSKLKSMVKDNV